jgi:hypothetical protein
MEIKGLTEVEKNFAKVFPRDLLEKFDEGSIIEMRMKNQDAQNKRSSQF